VTTPALPCTAAFDFDGTFIKGDSLTPYLQLMYRRRDLMRSFLKLSPVMTAYQTKRMPRQLAKERILTHFFGGKELEELQRYGALLARDVLPQRIRPLALRRLRWHQAQGHRCLLITASLSYWTQAFADEYELELIATRPEVIDGQVTGRIDGPNNYGPEKVRRLEAHLSAQEMGYLYAYGDTEGDRELLARADEGLFRPFHPQ
jgi:HAD superfamily hydrolase (TIGR01490 family)